MQLLESATLPFPDDSFDLVTALDVLEHIEDDGARCEKSLACCGRVGRSWPRFPRSAGCGERRTRSATTFAATPPVSSSTDARVGPSRRRLTYFNTLLFLPIAAVRLARRLLPRGDGPTSR